ADLLKVLDRLLTDVIIPVEQSQNIVILTGVVFSLIPGSTTAQRDGQQAQQSGQKTAVFHDSFSPCRMPESRRLAMIISTSVSSINSVEMALTSGVTEILIMV